MHFDRAAQAQARHAKQRRFAQQERAGDDANRRAAAHASWGAHRGLRVADPVEIADAALMEAARAAQAQQQQRRQQMGVPAGQGGGASIGGQPGGGQMGNQPGGSLQQRPGGPTMTPHVGAVPGGGGNRNTGVGGGGQVPQGQPGQAQMMPMQGQGQGGGQGGGQGNANNNQQYQMQMQQQQQMQRQMQQQQQRQQQMQMQGGGGGSGRPMQIPQGGGAQGPGAQGARQANSLPAPGNKPGGRSTRLRCRSRPRRQPVHGRDLPTNTWDKYSSGDAHHSSSDDGRDEPNVVPGRARRERRRQGEECGRLARVGARVVRPWWRAIQPERREGREGQGEKVNPRNLGRVGVCEAF